MTNPPIRIETTRLVLRDLNHGDEENVAKYANNIKVSQYLTL
ncbi:MAG: hypothetical protein WCI04_01435 [archaeon]